MSPKLQISSLDSYIDEEIDIKIIGCLKNTKVSIHAMISDDEGKQFSSYATFIADDEGIIDVSSQKPIKGTYNQADSSGLFWSMAHVDSKLGDYYEKSSADKISINLVLKIDGKAQDSVAINRYFYKDDVVKEVIEHDQIKGTLFHPKQNDRYPAVIILSGSDGGIQEHAAALLASKGYAVLALAYFGVEGAPKDLENIRLEYFQEATTWLKNHPFTNGEVSLIGYSRGGELALLLGSVFDDYQSIIAGAPSAYVTAGMKNGIFAPVQSWTLNQEDLTYIKFKYRPSTLFSMLKNWVLNRPISYLSIWDNTLAQEEEMTEERIQVENIKAPVMLLAGDDDQLWPSARYVKFMEEKLNQSKLINQNLFLYYENAGHFFAFPYSFINLPANVYMNVGGGMTMTFGGTKEANAEAAKDAWEQIQHFLDDNMNNKF